MKEKISYIAAWIFGIVFSLTAALNVTVKPFLSSSLLLVGLLLLPPVNIFIDKKYKLNLTVRARILFLLLFLVLGALIIGSMCEWFYCGLKPLR